MFPVSDVERTYFGLLTSAMVFGCVERKLKECHKRGCIARCYRLLYFLEFEKDCGRTYTEDMIVRQLMNFIGVTGPNDPIASFDAYKICF